MVCSRPHGWQAVARRPPLTTPFYCPLLPKVISMVVSLLLRALRYLLSRVTKAAQARQTPKSKAFSLLCFSMTPSCEKSLPSLYPWLPSGPLRERSGLRGQHEELIQPPQPIRGTAYYGGVVVGKLSWNPHQRADLFKQTAKQ